MKSNKKRLWTVGIIFVFFMFACVTINIYFPAEKVESVAGEIVNEIRGQEKEPGKESGEKDKSSLLNRSFFASFVSAAHAEEVTTVSNPTIRALKQRMKSRYASLRPYFQKGMLSEGSDGYLSIKSTSGLGLKDKRALKGLVDAENNDRDKLYAEIARALNIDPSQISRIGKIFAKEWQESIR